jgi:uncharacterized phage protein (TIGR02218 family)
MKNASAAVLAILNTQGQVQILRSDVYTFYLRNGSVYRWTDADHNQLIAGNTFVSGPIITRSKTKQSVGITVDTLQVTLTDAGGTLINGKPLIHQFKNGMFRGARVVIQKMFLLDWQDTSPGPVDWFEGIVGAPNCDGMSVSFEVRAMTEMLNKQMPADIHQDTCNNDLYDEVCGAVAATFTHSGTASSVVDQKRFTLGGVSQANTYFALGKVWFTSGQNAGQPPRTVKSYTGGVIEVFQPFPYPIAPGDACTARAGCDKLQTTCGTKFGRLNSGFQANPYIPVPETAIEGGGISGAAATSGGAGTAIVGSGGTAGRARNTYVQ